MPDSPPRKSRGGQPGNANAVTHGFYAKCLSANSRRTLGQAQLVTRAQLDDEIALMRQQLHDWIDANPTIGIGIIAKATREICRMVAVQHAMSPAAADRLEESANTVIDEIRDMMFNEAVIEEAALGD